MERHLTADRPVYPGIILNAYAADDSTAVVVTGLGTLRINIDLVDGELKVRYVADDDAQRAVGYNDKLLAAVGAAESR